MGQRMRLVCPNCAAQYEVDEAVIPEDGRDVQCSNCGHTWWQLRVEQPEGAAAVAPVPEPEAVAEAAPEPPAEPVAEAPAEETLEEPEAQPAPPPEEVETAAEPAAPEPGEEPREAAPPPPAATARVWSDGSEAAPPTPRPPQRTLDDAVLDVLRQEAARESQARRSERGAVEHQAEIALGATAPGLDAETADTRTGRRSLRSNLPDIEEINSTLDTQQSPAETGSTMALALRRRSGFRLGFTLMILIAAGVGFAYVFADGIAAAVPSLAPTMADFKESVDAGRLWLDSAALDATRAIRGLTEGE